MKRIIIILVLTIFMFPISIKAYECSNADRERLQKLASNVSYILEEVDYENNIYFDVIFTGVSDEIKIYSDDKNVSYFNLSTEYISETESVRLSLGKTYIFEIKSKDVCFFETFRTITVNTPIYNIYYNDPICDNVKDYSLCQKWHDNSSITYDEFVQKVNNYKSNNNKINDIINNNKDEEKDMYILFFNYYQKYYWYCLTGMILILVLLIYLWIKQNKKNKL